MKKLNPVLCKCLQCEFLIPAENQSVADDLTSIHDSHKHDKLSLNPEGSWYFRKISVEFFLKIKARLKADKRAIYEMREYYYHPERLKL